MNTEIMKSLNDGKDFTWIIKDEGDKMFSVSKNMFYIAGLGTVRGEPHATIQAIRDHVVEKIGLDNLIPKMNFHWKHIHSTMRFIEITFNLK